MMHIEYDDLPRSLQKEIDLRSLTGEPMVIVMGDSGPWPHKKPYYHFTVGIHWVEKNMPRSQRVDALVAKFHALLIGADP